MFLCNSSVSKRKVGWVPCCTQGWMGKDGQSGNQDDEMQAARDEGCLGGSVFIMTSPQQDTLSAHAEVKIVNRNGWKSGAMWSDCTQITGGFIRIIVSPMQTKTMLLSCEIHPMILYQGGFHPFECSFSIWRKKSVSLSRVEDTGVGKWDSIYPWWNIEQFVIMSATHAHNVFIFYIV